MFLYASHFLCCQSPALASIEKDGYNKCSVEFKLGFEADVFQVLLSLDMADMATPILVLIPFVEVSSLPEMDPRYFKESTTSICCLFIMVLMGVFWLALLTSTLLFSELTSTQRPHSRCFP